MRAVTKTRCVLGGGLPLFMSFILLTHQLVTRTQHVFILLVMIGESATSHEVLLS